MIKNGIFFLILLVFLSACLSGTTSPIDGPSNQPVSSPESTDIAQIPSISQTETSPLPDLKPTLPGDEGLPVSPTAEIAVTPLLSTASPTTLPSPGLPQDSNPSSEARSIVADHTVVDQFEEIPDSAIASASDLRVLFRTASIGENLSRGLDCLWGNYPGRRPNHCGDLFDLKYNRQNWEFQLRGNPGWIKKVEDFVEQTNLQADQFDVFGFLVAYADGLDDSTYPKISDPENFQKLYIEPLEALEAQHPEKIFIWSTMSLARTGFENEEKFNDMVRQYALEHNKILFDLADIEAHDPLGEQYTNDQGYEMLYEGYTNEERSGHLNEVGRERVAKSFWWLMARITGWEGIDR